MAETEATLADARAAYLSELIAAGHLIPSGVPGVYGRSGAFEGVIEHFERHVTRVGSDQNAEVMRFPPIFARKTYTSTDHIETMPQLLGSVHSFFGAEQAHSELVGRMRAGEDWTAALAPTDVMLVPAACYPLYPTATGTLPEGGRTVDLRTFVFRHEPSDDPARMQVFRQREFVRLGTPEQAVAHRDEWIRRGIEIHQVSRSRRAERARQRSVLRPRRPSHEGDPAGAESQVRAGLPDHL